MKIWVVWMELHILINLVKESGLRLCRNLDQAEVGALAW